jgi:gamma-glutamyltranspeptidase/glutathione hydrolase
MTRLAILFAALAVAATAFAQPAADVTPSSGAASAASVVARHGMVASQEARATRVGVDILERGGNAVDAAVAVGFALAATMPKAGNLGGGGFMIVHLAGRNESVAIDYREVAPAATTPDVFLDDKGEPDARKSRDTALSVGVPGTVAGLALAHEKYGSGKFTLAELIAPAEKFAREGVAVEDDLLDSLLISQARLARWPSAANIFRKSDGQPLGPGDLLVQADLAASLERIARGGARGFYEGETAEKFIASVRQYGSRMTLDDLKNYRAIVRPPVRGTYRGYDVISMPPPSSGGVHLVEMLNILEGFPLTELGAGSPAALHVMIEAMKLAYADRAEFLGDADAVEVPVGRLISKVYAASLRNEIDSERARSARELRPNSPAIGGGGDTTHYSVVDRDGNAVANT